MGKLTTRQVEGLIAPGRYTDGDGLALVVGSQGRRYWQLRFKLDGKRRDLSLGPVRVMSLRQAREAASNARLLIRCPSSEHLAQFAAPIGGGRTSSRV